MIVSDLTKWEMEKQHFHPVIRKGIDYIKKTDFSSLENGKYNIHDESMFCLVQETMTGPKSVNKAESHENYIDIQFLISGEERIGFARQSSENEIVESNLETQDSVFYQYVQNEIDIILKPGMFAVFFPSDIHRPCCNVKVTTRIRKAVVKIHKTFLISMKGGTEDEYSQC